MQTVEQIAAAIVAREGGFVDDPDDPGGATNHGVTIGTMRSLGLDLDGNGRVDKADVRKLDPAQAARIYVEHYFRRPRLDRLPQVVQASVFDMQVNAGANAVKILQRLVSRMGFPCADDGLVGPRTEAAVRAAAAVAPAHLADAYGIARRNYYYALADVRPASRKFARRKDGGKGGWITRAEEFIAPRHHLTDAQHRERTARWA
ncbi:MULTISPECIES: holin-associated N-acetylmuramidase [unclassified Paracoccus (in: a-proteobacteria)]|uniref:holin-associated N-acetylmuramidase n=1 Tax=unclassified Paracoccus (in: a-proteobacteria) TaxID=2688777 RepID=UPI0015FF1F79|nr:MULTISPECIES: holin-associated N-acetylmuramidase [unclassified Paracoccus (in: a-proteobacteria)]MBB1492437.1 peptidoglycan-binding protein [Paracoccus sp. MC1854]MBB1498976.1 peptidoglycan-binding protein [Paracoccus sp. MC1862]QQO45062.1 peptidoglycan-binding protein [Paracoccus sp. MC1862]